MTKITTRAKNAVNLLKRDPELFFKAVYGDFTPIKPKSPAKKKIKGIVFNFDLAQDVNIKAMYYRFYELEITRVMKKYLKKGGVFVDVGANIGYISAVAMGMLGKTGSVHSFEPVPRYFAQLKQLAEDNPQYNFRLNQAGLGDFEGKAEIHVTSLPNIGWNSMVPNYIQDNETDEVVEVPVLRLDNYLEQKGVKQVTLVKIDTEGYEFSIIKGMTGYFDKTGQRPPIICEITPAAYPLMGQSLTEFKEFMQSYGYKSYRLTDLKNQTDITTLTRITNILFVV